MNSLRICRGVLPVMRCHFLNLTRRQININTCSVKRTLVGAQNVHSILQNDIVSQRLVCYQSTVAQLERETIWNRMKKQMGFTGKLKYNKQKMKLSGYNMYVCCQSLLDFELIFKDLDLPDTFNSWFLITELHVWMCMVRLAQLGKEGVVVRNGLVEAMWEDVDKRSRQLGDAASMTARREGVRELANVFHASLYAYDEGILGDDKDLAGSVWRVLFEMNEKEPEQLALVVEYIRKQTNHLDNVNPELMLKNGLVTLLPFYGNKMDKDVVNNKLFKVFNRDMLS